MKVKIPKRLGVGVASLLLLFSQAECRGAVPPQGVARTAMGGPLVVAGRPCELEITAVDRRTIRISLTPLDESGKRQPIEDEPVLVRRDWPQPAVTLRSNTGRRSAKLPDLAVEVSSEPLTVTVKDGSGRLIQELSFDKATGAVDFSLGEGPVLGMGEGGPQFDRRGEVFEMHSGSGRRAARRLDLYGSRVPIPWLIGTAGWAIFVHSPLGGFDLSSGRGRFNPESAEHALPLDIFVVAGAEPAEMMAEYARLTGYPHMPPIWALGYQQSHRTLASPEAVLSVARTFREKNLPADVLIYLGTGFCPSGWNTGHGSFMFNPRAFPEPQAMINELHELGFHVVLHVVNPPVDLHGRAGDSDVPAGDKSHAANYWPTHREVLRLGIDGWWPDEGDPLDAEARLARNRMYWEGSQVDRPGYRPYALHRNGYAGMQRYAWLWSGDIDSKWETLQVQVPIGINTSLSGVPFWGTDTGGFVLTKELTGELYTRWFQFSAFCPLFRSHGRSWKLHLPWGWNTGDLGPPEMEPRVAGVPDTRELLNPEVEPICRKYLDLRYRLMPYLYSAVRDAHDTGLPIMRALWLHYPDDPQAVARGDEYLWGRDILVAPVTERGATSRKLYLPRGEWYDYWTQERVPGGQEIDRPVDLATMPLYVRAGAILPFGPPRHFTRELTYEPMTIQVYPGADGQFTLYEDDGLTFGYERGQMMRLRLDWKDQERRLTLRLEDGSQMLPPLVRKVNIQLVPEDVTRVVEFDGKPLELSF